MSTLSTYKTLLTERIGNSATVFHTEASRVAAINEAIMNVCESYDIPQMTKKAAITFSSGAAAMPTDFFRMVKLWTTIDSNVVEFTYMPVDTFDMESATSADYFWTVDYDISSGTRKFYLVPNTVTSCTMRYVKLPTVLSASTDESGVPSFFDDAVVYWAASILMRDENNLQRAMDYDRKVIQSLNSAYQAVQKIGGTKENRRLRSVYEKYPILNGRTP